MKQHGVQLTDEKIDAFTNVADRFAKRLIATHRGFKNDDREDIKQELLVAVLRGIDGRLSYAAGKPPSETGGETNPKTNTTGTGPTTTNVRLAVTRVATVGVRKNSRSCDSTSARS